MIATRQNNNTTQLYAADFGTESLRWFLDAGNARSSKGDEDRIVEIAAEFNNLDALEIALANPLVAAPNRRGNVALRKAIDNFHFAAAELLLADARVLRDASVVRVVAETFHELRWSQYLVLVSLHAVESECKDSSSSLLLLEEVSVVEPTEFVDLVAFHLMKMYNTRRPSRHVGALIGGTLAEHARTAEHFYERMGRDAMFAMLANLVPAFTLEQMYRIANAA